MKICRKYLILCSIFLIFIHESCSTSTSWNKIKFQNSLNKTNQNLQQFVNHKNLMKSYLKPFIPWSYIQFCFTFGQKCSKKEKIFYLNAKYLSKIFRLLLSFETKFFIFFKPHSKNLIFELPHYFEYITLKFDFNSISKIDSKFWFLKFDDCNFSIKFSPLGIMVEKIVLHMPTFSLMNFSPMATLQPNSQFVTRRIRQFLDFQNTTFILKKK